MSETDICILGLGAYLPSRVMSNDEWTQYVDTSDEWITTRTGIKHRRIAAPEESTVDLAEGAARLALADASVHAEDLNEIIVATDTPEVFIPDTACFVQHRLGAREVPAYELGSSGCAGFLQALDIARARVHLAGGRILVIGVDMLTRMISWQERETCVLFGDAAGAAVVGHGSSGARIISAVAGTDGSQSGILGMEVGGTREPFTLEGAQQGRHQHVVMNGREVFKAAVRRMSDATYEVLAKANVALKDVSLVIPHQANLRIIQAVAKKLDLSMDKFYVNVHKYGNTGAASIPLALWEARKDGRIAPNDLVLLTGFGAGFHWGAVLLQF
jgi:3-oxoacyl-[acyl-carrier-protein] synthase III